MNNQPELNTTGPEDVDNLINNSSSRSTKFDDWWVITGTHVRLPEDMPARRPVGTNNLLVCADTISLGVSGATQIVLTHWSHVIVMGKDFKRYNGCIFLREKAVLDDSKEEFRITFFSDTLEHF